MKWLALAAAAVVSAWAGSAEAGTVLYSTSGVIPSGQDVYLSLPLVNISIKVTSPNITPIVDNLNLYETYDFQYDAFPVGFAPANVASEVAEIYDGDDENLSVFAGAPLVSSGSFFETLLFTPQHTVSYFYPQFPAAAANSLYSYVSNEEAESAVFDAYIPANVPDDPFTLTVSTVPEPSAWVFLMLGLWAIGSSLRTRRGISYTR
jgi:hypothetical protein